MSDLLARCAAFPVRDLAADDVLVTEGRPAPAMYVVVEGTFTVTNQGARVATIAEPGAVIGEISALLDTLPGATVTATGPARVHVVDDTRAFVEDPQALLAIARTLARRVNGLVAYLADVKVQYAAAGGHLELLDEILAELTFGEQTPTDPGSERDPDPYY